MPSLRETQRAFAAALFDADESGIAPLLHGDAEPAAGGVSVYRNNLRSGFSKALQLDFPVTERLVGEECFHGLARDYLALHPSRSGDLSHVGEGFPGFLATQFSGSGFEYLAHVAALERACAEVLVAPDGVGIDLNWLAGLPPEQYDTLLFLLEPACRLLRSAYPIVRIWQANQPDGDASTLIDLSSGGECVLVHRGSDGVALQVLTPAQYEFCAALSGGSTLGDAVDRAGEVDEQFDLQALLQRLLSLRAIRIAQGAP